MLLIVIRSVLIEDELVEHRSPSVPQGPIAGKTKLWAMEIFVPRLPSGMQPTCYLMMAWNQTRRPGYTQDKPKNRGSKVRKYPNEKGLHTEMCRPFE